MVASHAVHAPLSPVLFAIRFPKPAPHPPSVLSIPYVHPQYSTILILSQIPSGNSSFVTMPSLIASPQTNMARSCA